MAIMDEPPQGTVKPGEVLQWETPEGMQWADKDGCECGIRYLTHDGLVSLDRIRIELSPRNKSEINMSANPSAPDRRVSLYWHIESDVLAPMPPPVVEKGMAADST